MTAIDELVTTAGPTARTALVEQVGSEVVGEHVGVLPEAAGLVTHYFACTQAGYPGWRWAVTVVCAEGQDTVTINEVVLLPGDDAIVAPSWLPWRERIKPGDLSPGDLLPVEEDDPRLVPAYLSGDPGDEEPREVVDSQDYHEVADKLGLGRARVLSLEGRDSAAQRWYDGEPGPAATIAQSAPAQCESCGFLVRISGPLSVTFGVCANEHANDDGRVVSLNHGCGAHSEAQLRKKQLPVPLADPVFDTISGEDLEEF